jgi:hypothetical protein
MLGAYSRAYCLQFLGSSCMPEISLRQSASTSLALPVLVHAMLYCFAKS